MSHIATLQLMPRPAPQMQAVRTETKGGSYSSIEMTGNRIGRKSLHQNNRIRSGRGRQISS